jgi:D-alanyl-D-alanine dipeptidase
MKTTQGTPEPQAALDRITIIENHDSLADLRDIPGLTFGSLTGNQVIPFLRAPVAAMLARANAALPKEYHFHVISALRDIEHQKYIWDSHMERNRKLHPEWPEHMVRRMTNKYAAPVDHPAPPGHCTGAAVDVVLQKADGSFVDLVPPEIEDWSMSHTWSSKVSPEVQELRLLMLEAMTQAGFSNCRDEYWHYSWGDSGWAVRVGEKTCHYGVIQPPVWE